MFDAVWPASLSESMARVLPALTAARAAHEAVVDASIDLIALSRFGQREVALRHRIEHFDAAVMALGLAALEHLPLDGRPTAVAPLAPDPCAEPSTRSVSGEAGDRAAGLCLAEAPAGPRAASERAGLIEVSASALPEASAVAVRPQPISEAPIDVRHVWSELDEDSEAGWPTEDPGPVGSERSSRPLGPPVDPERVVAVKVHLETGGGALAAGAFAARRSPQAAAALRALGFAPAPVDSMAQKAEQTPPMPFNAERGLDAVERALGDGAPIRVLAPLVTVLLKGGVAADDKRLNALLAERIEEFTDPFFKSLRSKTRRFQRAQVARVEERLEVWPEAAALKGKRVVLIGGACQSMALERLQTRLPGVDLAWVETTASGCGVRQVQAVCARISQGSVDVLLLLQGLISHKVRDVLQSELKTCGHEVRMQPVLRGFGLAQIRLALQGCLANG